MLERTWLGKLAVVSFVVSLFVFFAFSVIGEESAVVSSDNSNISPEVVSADSPTENIAAEQVVVDLQTEKIADDSVKESDDASADNSACFEDSVCVPLESVLNDQGIEPVRENSSSEEVVLLNLDSLNESENMSKSSEISVESDSNEQANVLSSDENKEVKITLVDEGKKIMETVVNSKNEEEVFRDTISQEKVEDISEDKQVKEITVSNEEHFDSPIVYYTDLFEEARADQIAVNWKTEGKEVRFETYDIDGNGLVDRISFEIPHLSTQVFEVVVDFDSQEDSNFSNSISLESVSIPNAVINTSNVNFAFNVSYYNLSALSCGFELRNLTNLIANNSFSSSNTVDANFSLANGNYSWILNCSDLTNLSIGNYLNGVFLVNYNYIPIVKLSVSPANVNRGNSVSFGINVSAPVNGTISYTINYGDGTSVSGSSSGKSLLDNKNHVYNSTGNFVANLTANVDYGGFSQSVSDLATIVVNSPPITGDTQSPKIHLIDPTQDEDFDLNSTSDEIAFSYNVTDDVKIANCTFEVYYYNGSSFGELVLSELKNDINNGSTVNYRYHDFDEGDYSWDVECYDNSSNRGTVSDRDFSITYPREDSEIQTVSSKAKNHTSATPDEIEDVDSVINAINDFIVAEEKYGPEERTAVTDLGLDDNLKLYKKKLLQMKLDLERNLDYVQTSDQREKRKQEIFYEIDEMKKNIPLSLDVSDSYEFFKNSLDVDMNEVVSSYVSTKNLVLDARGIKEMAKQNGLLQNQMTVSTRVKKVSVSYFDGNDEKFILVAKALTFKSKSFDSIVEILPKDLVSDSDSVEFLSEATVLKKDPIFEISLDKIVSDTLVYKVKKDVSLKDFEKTSTLVFKEDLPQSTVGGVTGFVSLVGNINTGFGFYLSWVLAFMVFVFIGIFSYRGIRLNRLKKHKDVRALMALSSEIEKLLVAKEVEKAREKYHSAKALYPSLPEAGKKYAYSRLQKLILEIDRKDISLLVREFIGASKEGRKNDAMMIYQNISKLYPRMPEKFRQKVFEKIGPYVSDLRK